MTVPPLASLTQQEAAARAALLHVQRYDLTFDFTDLLEGTRLTTTSTITFTCAEPGAGTFVDCAATVQGATLNGQPLDPATAARGRLPLPDLQATNTLTVTAHQDDTGSSAGILRTVDPSDGLVYVWTSFEPDEARKVFACFDQPDLKAVFGITAIVPAAWTALSNSAPLSVTDADAARTFTFADTPRLSTYVTVVNAGPFHEIRKQVGGYDLGLYARQSLVSALEAGAPEIFAFTEHGLAWFGDKFGTSFPQERYDQVFVPNMGGAMENWGSVTHGDFLLYRSEPTDRDRATRGEFVLHEMAHMWFGDLVTMRWWDDLWLNEAFASWASYWALAAMPGHSDAWASFTATGKQAAYRQDSSPATHPIRGVVPDVDQATANFDAITYDKGMSVLHQLFAYIGEEAFVAGLQRYFRDHAYANTVLDDLMGAFGEAAGTDLGPWTEAWLDHAGTDVLCLTRSADGGAVTVQGPDGARPRPHRFDIASYAEDGSLLATTAVTTSGEGATVGLPEAAAHLLNAGDLTFASVRPDEQSRAWLAEHAGRLPDAMARVLAVTAAWDVMSRGGASGPDLVRTARAVLSTERAPVLVESLLGMAATAAERWTAPDRIEEQRAAVAEVAYALTDDPANERAALRVLAQHASTPEQLARVEAATDDDVELAWRLLVRRAELGRHDPEAVTVLLERDPDPDAWVSALAVDAARPEAAAKEKVWVAVMEEARVPLVDGFWLVTDAFWRPGQEQLLGPYAARYLEVVAPLSGGMLDKGPRINRMYPALVGDQGFLEASERVAHDDSVAAMVRQSLLAANDNLRRMLVARGL